MAARGLGDPENNPRLAERAALMTRAHKRDVDKAELRGQWKRQAVAMGFDAEKVVERARENTRKIFSTVRVKDPAGTEPSVQAVPEPVPVGLPVDDRPLGTGSDPGAEERARAAVEWGAAHLSEREAVFTGTDLLTAALAMEPGARAGRGRRARHRRAGKGRPACTARRACRAETG